MNFDASLIITIVLGIVIIVNGILLIINNFEVKKYKKMYDKALAKFDSHENVTDEFQEIYRRINEVEKTTKNSVDIVNNFAEKMKNNIQKIGFVKYNAYDDTENKLSFSITLLDERNDGVLLNHVYSKHGSNVYAKLVEQGVIKDRISEEEAMSLKMACDDKNFKDRKVVELKNSKKK